ncbi:MAG: hypothetical protein U0M39_11015 [Oscillospiraceae bacterium]|nr:hypothetical protein [Oscillospiraceae bacterium]
MNLDELYSRVSETISSLDFGRIWPGFRPLKFALYDDEKCFYDGAYIEKSGDFCANTSISFQGEQIAIWKVVDDLPAPVLASKIVHEMFHGYQTVENWNCWSDEMEALYRYQYNADNLSLKLRENELLLRILDHFDEASYQELLSHRKRRSERHPYEYAYESKVEEIEGTATYVEWMTLRQLDEQAAAAMTQRMRVAMTKPECLFPIRISCYYSGALMVNALAASGAYSFNQAERPVACSMLKTVCPSDGDFPERESCCRRVSDAITSFEETSAHIIQSAIKKNKVVLTGPLELLCVNIYDARFYKGYMTSRFFLMYRDESGEKMIPGNFVIEMTDEKTISKVYEAPTM